MVKTAVGYAYHGIVSSHTKRFFFIHCSLDEFPVGKMDIIMKGQEEKYPWWESWSLSWPSQQCVNLHIQHNCIELNIHTNENKKSWGNKNTLADCINGNSCIMQEFYKVCVRKQYMKLLCITFTIACGPITV